MTNLKKSLKKDQRNVNISCHEKTFLGTITTESA